MLLELLLLFTTAVNDIQAIIQKTTPHKSQIWEHLSFMLFEGWNSVKMVRTDNLKAGFFLSVLAIRPSTFWLGSIG